MNKKRKAFGAIPQEISTNLQAPEAAPSDKRFTGRTKQLNFKVREDFYWQLKNRAVVEKCMLVEVLERAFAEYERSLFFEISHKGVKSETDLNLLNSSQENRNNYQPTRLSLRAKERELLNSKRLEIDCCSFSIQDEQNWTTCNKPLFNKKKQLCRSHNHQVWKRFNQFLKPKSVSSTAAWLGIWEDSGDWKYFWGLGEQKNHQTKQNNSPIEAKYLDKPHIRVAIQKNSKEPALKNWINHLESRKISELLKTGNYGLRTGTKLGEYYFCALDIDRPDEQYHFPQTSYVKTHKGVHYYLLFKSLPENIPLFYQGEKIGRLMSSGKQIIGSNSVHPMGTTYQFVEKEEMFLKFEDEQHLANYLSEYEIILEK